jgi:hypothetical protein
MYQSHRSYEDARRIVREKEKFKKRVISSVGVGFFLIGINLFTSPGYFWAIFPIMGMGLGLFLKGMKLYGPLKNRENEDQKIERELRRNQYERGDIEADEDGLDLPDMEDGLTLKNLKKREELRAQWNENDLV